MREHTTEHGKENIERIVSSSSLHKKRGRFIFQKKTNLKVKSHDVDPSPTQKHFSASITTSINSKRMCKGRMRMNNEYGITRPEKFQPSIEPFHINLSIRSRLPKGYCIHGIRASPGLNDNSELRTLEHETTESIDLVMMMLNTPYPKVVISLQSILQFRQALLSFL